MAPKIFPLTIVPGELKHLPQDVFLVAAYSDTSGWQMDCFVKGATSLEEALSFAVAERTHLSEHAVMVTQVGGVRSLRKFVKSTQPPPPPPEPSRPCSFHHATLDLVRFTRSWSHGDERPVAVLS